MQQLVINGPVTSLEHIYLFDVFALPALPFGAPLPFPFLPVLIRLSFEISSNSSSFCSGSSSASSSSYNRIEVNKIVSNSRECNLRQTLLQDPARRLLRASSGLSQSLVLYEKVLGARMNCTLGKED